MDHQLIKSFCCWISIFEHQQDFDCALYASASINKLGSDYRSSEESILEDNHSGSTITSNTDTSLYSSLCSSISTNQSSSFGPSSMIHELLDDTVQMLDNIQEEIRKISFIEEYGHSWRLEWRKCISFIWIVETQLKVVAANHCPWLCPYPTGHKGAIIVEHSKYSFPYETLHCPVLFSFPRPHCLQKDR